MRGLKILGWSLLGVVGLFVLAMVLVAWLVDPNDYKDEVAAAVKEKTGRDLELEGDLELSVFPWLALELGPARLGNPEGFGPGPFVSFAKADVGVRLFPLLRGQLEVRRLKLEGLQLNLVKNAQGRTNWQDLTETSTSEAVQPADAGESTLPDIGGLSIKDSALDYRDLGTSAHWRLRDLNVDTGRLREGDPFDVEMAFTLDQGEGSAATALKLKSEVTLDTQAERYAFKDFDLDATLKAAAKDEKDRHIALQVPAMEADLAQQTLAAPQFSLRAAGAELNGGLSGTQIVDAPALTGTLNLKPVSPRELMRELNAEEPKTTDPKALSSLAFESKLKATGKSIGLEDLKLTLDDTHMTGRLGIEDLEAKAIRFDLTVDQIDVDRYLEPEEKEKKPEEAPVELPVKGLEALNARGTLAIGTLTLAGIKMSAVKVSVDAKDGLTRINPAQAKLYGGAYRGNVALDGRSSVAKLSMEEKVSGVDLAGLLGDLLDTKRLSGRATANAVLAARGTSKPSILRTLDGRIDFDVADGAIEGKDLWYEMRRARALWKREAAPTQPDTGRTTFRSLKGSATIAKGVLDNRDFVMEMDYLKVYGAGTLDLNTEKLDYKLQTNLYKMPPEDAGAEMQDLKAAQIPVRVSGTLADMKVRPDFDALAKAEAKQKVDEKKQEVTDKLKDKLNKWLGGDKN
ncbi:MAG TPA: AsmA family protein [Steroidobacteraceae bacterium]|nr:AsmA family protein [Steroidobacteraceae bacterium]